MELFRGEGSLSEAHRALGLRVHPGFEVKDGSHGDLLLDSTMQAAIGLITRRVVRAVHVAPVCTSFGTLRRPRVRSKMQPFGFDFTEAATALGNHFAVRAAFILFLCLAYDIIGTGEQPRGSVMFRLVSFCDFSRIVSSQSIFLTASLAPRLKRGHGGFPTTRII